jgi:hypothetical protein
VFHDVSPFGLLGISRLTLVRRHRRGDAAPVGLDRPAPLLLHRNLRM